MRIFERNAGGFDLAPQGFAVGRGSPFFALGVINPQAGQIVFARFVAVVDACPIIVLVIEPDEHQLTGALIVAKTISYVRRPTIAPIGIYDQHTFFYFVVEI